MFEKIINRISYHAIYDLSIIDALKFARNNGFSGIQIGVELPHLSFEILSDGQCKEIGDFAEENNTSISIHAPDETTSLFEFSNYLRHGILKYYDALFSFAEKVGAKIITIHTGTMATFPTDDVPEQKTPETDIAKYLKAFQENIRNLLRLAGNRFIICVENYMLNNLILEHLQTYLDKNQLSLCWDLAKTYDRQMVKDEELESYFLRNINHVKQVHLHDINAQGKSHRVVGSGLIDFRHFLPILNDVDILDYCIEVRPKEKAKESKDNLYNLLGIQYL